MVKRDLTITRAYAFSVLFKSLFFGSVKRMKITIENIPFVWLPVFWGLGVGLYFLLPFEPSSGACLCLALAGGLLVRRAPFAACLAGGFVLAAFSALLFGTPMLDDPKGPVRVAGIVEEIEPKETGALRLLLSDLSIEGLPKEQTPRRIHLTLGARLIKPESPAITRGAHLTASARLMPLSAPLYPGGFDFRRHAYFKGIGATGYIMGKMSIEPAAGSDAFFPALRAKIRASVLQVLSGDTAGLAIILLTGDKSYLSGSASEAMRAVGLAHLLAIAGLHIGIVGGIVFGVLRFLMALCPPLVLRWPAKKIAAAAALLAIGFYTLLVGAPVPTRRAFVMAGLCLLGVMVDRIGLSMRSLAVAAFVLLAFWPFMLLAPGFQLSFAAVAALIAVADWRRRTQPRLDNPSWLRRIAGHIGAIAAMSVVATIGTMPFSLYHFQELGLYSALANALAVPLTSFILMPLALLALALMPLGAAGGVLRLLGVGETWLLKLSHMIAALPGAHFLPPVMTLPWLIVATAGGLWFCLVPSRRRWIGLGVLAVALGVTLAGARPEALVSADGDFVMWRRDTGAVMAGVPDKPDKFLLQNWARVLGQGPEKAIYLAEGEAADVSCDARLCRGGAGKDTIMLVKDPSALDEACATPGAALIVLPESEGACPEGSPVQVLDFVALTQDGAAAFYAGSGAPRLVFDHAAPVDRPWSLGGQQAAAFAGEKSVFSIFKRGLAYLLFKNNALGYRQDDAGDADSADLSGHDEAETSP